MALSFLLLAASAASALAGDFSASLETRDSAKLQNPSLKDVLTNDQLRTLLIAERDVAEMAKGVVEDVVGTADPDLFPHSAEALDVTAAKRTLAGLAAQHNAVVRSLNEHGLSIGAALEKVLTFIGAGHVGRSGNIGIVIGVESLFHVKEAFAHVAGVSLDVPFEVRVIESPLATEAQLEKQYDAETEFAKSIGVTAAGELFEQYQNGQFARASSSGSSSRSDDDDGGLRRTRTSALRTKATERKDGGVLAPPSGHLILTRQMDSETLNLADDARPVFLEFAAATQGVKRRRAASGGTGARTSLDGSGSDKRPRSAGASSSPTPTASASATASPSPSASSSASATLSPTPTPSVTASATPHRQINPAWVPHAGSGVGYMAPGLPLACNPKFAPGGTVGFFVTRNGNNHRYFVTNEHVVTSLAGHGPAVLQFHRQAIQACGAAPPPSADWIPAPGAPTRIGTIPAAGSVSAVHDIGIVRLEPAVTTDYACAIPPSNAVTILARAERRGWVRTPLVAHTIPARGAAITFGSSDYLTGALKAFNYLTRRNVAKGGARTGYTEGMITMFGKWLSGSFVSDSMRWNYYAVEATWAHGLFTMQGDSGSAVISRRSMPWYHGAARLVGLNHAGNTGISLLPPLWPNKYSFIIPADQTLAEVSNMVDLAEGGAGAITLC